MAAEHTEHTLLRDLRRLGLSPGDGAWVHASLRSVGMVNGGASKVIKALLAAVGETGSVSMPGFSTDAYTPSDIERENLSAEECSQMEYAVSGFDIERSPASDMGILAETFRTWPGTARSAHPTTSVCFHGPDAQDIIAPHAPAWAMGPRSPFGRMRRRPNMKILLIGVGWTRCTPLHTAENDAAHKRLKIRRFKSGPGRALWFETPDVADDMGRLFPAVGHAFEDTGRVTYGRLGDADVRVCGFDDLVRFAATWINTANAKSGARH